MTSSLSHWFTIQSSARNNSQPLAIFWPISAFDQPNPFWLAIFPVHFQWDRVIPAPQFPMALYVTWLKSWDNSCRAFSWFYRKDRSNENTKQHLHLSQVIQMYSIIQASLSLCVLCYVSLWWFLMCPFQTCLHSQADDCHQTSFFPTASQTKITLIKSKQVQYFICRYQLVLTIQTMQIFLINFTSLLSSTKSLMDEMNKSLSSALVISLKYQ